MGSLGTQTVEEKNPTNDTAKESTGDPLFTLMTRIECYHCFDTNIAIRQGGSVPPAVAGGSSIFFICPNCLGKNRVWSEPAEQLQDIVWTRKANGRTLELEPLTLARMLTHFTSQAPLKLQHIANYYKVDLRAAKALIRTLREDWVLPIGSHRQPPYGAYWIMTVQEFSDWSREYRGQAMTSLVTIHRMQRVWYPTLYGQTTMSFVQMIADELQERL